MNPENIAKQVGMSLSLEANKDLIEKLRAAAISIGEDKGYCSIDDVRELLGIEGRLPNGVGGLFKDGNWIFHEYIQARHKNSHARIIARWRFVGKQVVTGILGGGRNSLLPEAEQAVEWGKDGSPQAPTFPQNSSRPNQGELALRTW